MLPGRKWWSSGSGVAAGVTLGSLRTSGEVGVSVGNVDDSSSRIGASAFPHEGHCRVPLEIGCAQLGHSAMRPLQWLASSRRAVRGRKSAVHHTSRLESPPLAGAGVHAPPPPPRRGGTPPLHLFTRPSFLPSLGT